MDRTSHVKMKKRKTYSQMTTGNALRFLLRGGQFSLAARRRKERNGY